MAVWTDNKELEILRLNSNLKYMNLKYMYTNSSNDLPTPKFVHENCAFCEEAKPHTTFFHEQEHSIAKRPPTLIALGVATCLKRESHLRIADPQPVKSLDDVRALNPEMIYYSVGTCWWTANPDDLYDGPVPLDPAGSPLMQTDEIEDWLTWPEQNLGHYKSVEAFILAYHGNVVDEAGNPVCATGWETYQKLVEERARRGS